MITDVKFDVHGRYKSGGGNFLANIRIDSRGVNQNMLRPGEFGDNSVCKWRFPDAYRNITSLTDWNVDPDVVNDVEIRVRRNLNQDVMYVNAFKIEVRTERPVLTLEPSLLDFGDVCVGESRSLSVRIRNDGEGFLEGHVPSGAIDDGFVVTAGSGSYHLGPGQWRDVTVAFSPTDEGQYLSSIAGDLDPLIGLPLAYEFEEIEVRGNGQSGNPTPNVTSYGFGEVAIGADSLATFLIQNGPCPSVIDVRLDDLTDDAFSVVSGGGVFIIPAGALHPVTVRFAPCRDDFFSGSLDLGPDLDFIDLSGLCNQSPCEVTGGDLSFGDVPVGEGRTLSFAIRNRGCDPLGGMLRLVDGAPEFALVGSPDYFLDPGQEAAFSVMFAPTTDDLFFGTIETGCDDISVELDGFGVLVGECSVEPIDLTFPDTPLGEETQQTFAIHNGSNVPISGDVAFADSCPAFRFVDGSGPYTLPPGGRVLVTLAFRPCEDDVYFCDVLTGCDDDVLLDGEGIGDACRVAPVDLDFGDVPIGSAVEQSFTITNDSCAELSGVLSLDDPDDVFTLVPSVAAYSIPPGDSLTVAVTFTPADEDLSFGTVITGCFDDVELVGAGVAPG
ncbi:MAG: choice-of-anchor D domain-containing protein, partial [Acidimicrobiia bacterium]|nr:choice-of-anchor D domain-containing protein [Acidimicrobiia bacterium]